MSQQRRPGDDSEAEKKTLSDEQWKNLSAGFPHFKREEIFQVPPFDKDSKERFNCIAATLAVSNFRILFSPPKDFNWPPTTPEQFNAFYGHYGFKVCEKNDPRADIDVWGTDEKHFLHVSYRHDANVWTSKLGIQGELIYHPRDALAGNADARGYGKYLFSFRFDSYTRPSSGSDDDDDDDREGKRVTELDLLHDLTDRRKDYIDTYGVRKEAPKPGDQDAPKISKEDAKLYTAEYFASL